MYLLCFRFELQNNVVYLQTESTYNRQRTTDDRRRMDDVKMW
jgi:hypothetical protein